ncbi:MAG: hypothetical protein IKI15_01950 [Lachnospiraceae bacterium]|nr:hypothetical protein [Lachnospiraceae bacterium]
MKKIDIRLSDESTKLLAALKGKPLQSYCHEEFHYTNTSSQVAKLIALDGGELYVYSFVEPQDYFGTEEEVAVWMVSQERLPLMNHKKLVEVPVGETVKDVLIVQENQKVFCDGEQTYDVWLTRGIIFDFGNRQVAFEKDVWFSEEIIIHKGYNLIASFKPKELFGKDWNKEYRTECFREILRV